MGSLESSAAEASRQQRLASEYDLLWDAVAVWLRWNGLGFAILVLLMACQKGLAGADLAMPAFGAVMGLALFVCGKRIEFLRGWTPTLVHSSLDLRQPGYVSLVVFALWAFPLIPPVWLWLYFLDGIFPVLRGWVDRVAWVAGIGLLIQLNVHPGRSPSRQNSAALRHAARGAVLTGC